MKTAFDKWSRLLISGLFAVFSVSLNANPAKPNILLIIADDWSYPHAGVYGDTVVRTPSFDRIASEGVLFHQAYVSSPSCTPSRAAVLTGQDFWRLGEGANLYGSLSKEHPVYPDLLAEAGYHTGFTGKGWGPGSPGERLQNPAGKRYLSFAKFLENRSGRQPFCFWFGSHNPHRGYKQGAGEAAGISPEKIQLPGCFPDHETIRKDVADYYYEVEAFDQQVGRLLAQLDSLGELDHTLIVVTSDNGMPFPRCKSNVYDMGTRVPLAIRWGNQIPRNSQTMSFTNLTDLAPTFLQLAGVNIPPQMTGKSILPFPGSESGSEKKDRKHVIFGKERHVPGQEKGDWGGYPSRAIRTDKYLYVKNFRPDRWPAGTPDYAAATIYPAYYADVDQSPSRAYMIDHKEEDSAHQRLFSLAFEKRPSEELYDLSHDPDQLINLADSPSFSRIKKKLAKQLMKELRQTGDPRALGNGEFFDTLSYSGGGPLYDGFLRMGPRFATMKSDAFSSGLLSGQRIEVLTPVNVHYGEEFPVLYIFAGENLFHSYEDESGKRHRGWQLKTIIDSLYIEGAIPRVIVVGIYPGKNAEGAGQPEFIIEELKPWVESQFRVKAGAENTIIGGAGKHGTKALSVFCKYPEIFGGVICLSPFQDEASTGMWRELITKIPKPSVHKIYVDIDPVNNPEPAVEIRKVFQEKGYSDPGSLMMKEIPGDKVGTRQWRRRFHEPLVFIFGEG